MYACDCHKCWKTFHAESKWSPLCPECEKRERIGQEWDKIVNQDNLSDEEALIIVAKNAGVTYGEARDVLCAGWRPEHLPAHS